MFDRFTERARQVMVLARQEAQRLRNDYIGTEHILFGLVQEGNGVAAQVLKTLDVDAGKVQTEIERLVERGTSPITDSSLPFTPRAKRILECSLDEAQRLNQDYIGSEHLLLGLIRECDGPAAHILQNLGVRFEEVRERVLQLIGDTSTQKPPGQGPPGPLPLGMQDRAEAVESILRKRLERVPSTLHVAGTLEVQVRCSAGPKGWGFQFWLGHEFRGGLRSEMALWVDDAATLEKEFASMVELFVRIIRDGREGKERPDEPEVIPPAN